MTSRGGFPSWICRTLSNAETWESEDMLEVRVLLDQEDTMCLVKGRCEQLCCSCACDGPCTCSKNTGRMIVPSGRERDGGKNQCLRKAGTGATGLTNKASSDYHNVGFDCACSWTTHAGRPPGSDKSERKEKERCQAES